MSLRLVGLLNEVDLILNPVIYWTGYIIGAENLSNLLGAHIEAVTI